MLTSQCAHTAAMNYQRDIQKCKDEIEESGLSLDGIIAIPLRRGAAVTGALSQIGRLLRLPKKSPSPSGTSVGIVPIIGDDDDTVDARLEFCLVSNNASLETDENACRLKRAKAKIPKHCGE